jgi:hypothetical protein
MGKRRGDHVTYARDLVDTQRALLACVALECIRNLISRLMLGGLLSLGFCIGKVEAVRHGPVFQYVRANIHQSP